MFYPVICLLWMAICLHIYDSYFIFLIGYKSSELHPGGKLIVIDCTGKLIVIDVVKLVSMT